MTAGQLRHGEFATQSIDTAWLIDERPFSVCMIDTPEFANSSALPREAVALLFQSRKECPKLSNVLGFVSLHLLEMPAHHDEIESFLKHASRRAVAPGVAHGNLPRTVETGRDDVGTVTHTLIE